MDWHFSRDFRMTVSIDSCASHSATGSIPASSATAANTSFKLIFIMFLSS
jgi:hypothetical protein